jgi:hypothetical protein
MLLLKTHRVKSYNIDRFVNNGYKIIRSIEEENSVKIMFECKESLYQALCEAEEYYRSTAHKRERKVESLEQVINLLLDRGLAYISLYEEVPDFEAYRAKRYGAEVSLDDEGNLRIFFPEEPREE